MYGLYGTSPGKEKKKERKSDRSAVERRALAGAYWARKAERNVQLRKYAIKIGAEATVTVYPLVKP